MTIDNIILELSKAETIVKGWKTKPTCSIEREIVLEKLRVIYDEIIFYEPATEQSSYDLSETTEQPQEPIYEAEEDIEEQILDKDIYGLDDKDDIVTFTTPDDDEQQQEEVVYIDEPEQEPKEHSIENILSTSNVNGNIIRTLYGDDVVTESRVEPAESINAEQAPEVEAEEALAPEPIVERESIRARIGMNDKYLMTRNLFDGDSRIFEKTIADLDAMSDLNDAMFYIYENFNWNPDDNSVKLLVSLLEQKLS